MWDFFAEILFENFDKFFFSLVTFIVVSAAILDIRNKNVPPGPTGVPFLGFLPFLNRETPYKHLAALTQQYGRVFGVQLGSVYAVVVADVKLIRQALTGQESQPIASLYLTNGINQEKGIANGAGKCWVDAGTVVGSVCKDFDGKLPKSVIQDEIRESVRDFLQDIRGNLGDEQDINPPLRNAIGMMMTGIIFGKRFDRKHPDWVAIQSTLSKSSKIDTLINAMNFIPLLRRMPSNANKIEALVSGRKKSREIYQNLLTTQSKSPESLGVPQCLLDTYLFQIEKLRGGDATAAENEQMLQGLSELVNGEWETTLATLKWLYLYMALYPEVQEKMRIEVDTAISGKGEVGFEHLEKLPYTEATILEVWRHQTIVPFGIPRVTKEKTKIGDYIIPEDSMVIPLLWAVNNDSRLWENPEIFSPERFLYEDGSIFRNDNLLPLQTENRLCIGDNLIRWTVTLFLANTLNQFQIQFPKGCTYNISDAAEFGTTLVPRPYHLVFHNLKK